IGFMVGGEPPAAAVAPEAPAARAAQPASTSTMALPPGHPEVPGHAPAPASALPPGHPEIGPSAPPPSQPEAREVERAKGENAKRVAEIVAERDALANKRVRVRGVVVKTIGGIKGFSYSHLQDGSGSPQSNDNDLTVTTRFALERGSVVTLEGKLERNVD